MKTSLILAGAGARGIIQVGMIKAYLETRKQYHALYGSSVGAINGAMLHAGQFDDLVEMWLKIRNKDVFKQAPWNMLRKDRGCLYDSSPLRNLLQKTVDFEALKNAEGVLSVNVTNLGTYKAERYLFGRHLPGNPLAALDIIYASASPPILMSPVKTPMGTLTDGGITNNYSVIDAVKDGADELIILAPMVPQPKPIKNIIDAIDSTVSIQLWNQLQRELAFVEKLNSIEGYRKVDVKVIGCDRPVDIGILDFDIDDRQGQIDYGYKLAMKALS